MDRTVHLVFCIIVSLLIVVESTAAKTAKDKTDFRNVRWGMTRLEVMASEEKAPEVFGLSVILYKPEIEGREFYLIYEFVENRLSDAEYRFVAHNTNDYLWLKRMVGIKYGSPFISRDGGSENFEYKWKEATTEIILKPGRKRECVIRYKGLKYRYLKAIRKNKITEKKVKNAKKTF